MKRKKLLKKLSNKKKLRAEDVLKFYDYLDLSEKYSVDSYFEDKLEDDIRDKLEVEFDFDDVTLDDLSCNVAERLYEELHEEYGETEIETPNLYDQDKLDLLKKAFDIYNLGQLIEKLEITQREAM